MVNVFYTHKDPKVCAQNLDDARVVKMTTETMQILHAAMNNVINNNSKIKVLDEKGNIFSTSYKSTTAQRNHPSVIWASVSSDNFKWLIEHYIALEKEYRVRYPKNTKRHATVNHFPEVKYFYKTYKGLFSNKVFTVPTVASNIKEFLKISDAVRCYKIIMLHKWWILDTRQPKWSNSNPPDWINDIELVKVMVNTLSSIPAKRFKPSP